MNGIALCIGHIGISRRIGLRNFAFSLNPLLTRPYDWHTWNCFHLAKEIRSLYGLPSPDFAEAIAAGESNFDGALLPSLLDSVGDRIAPPFSGLEVVVLSWGDRHGLGTVLAIDGVTLYCCWMGEKSAQIAPLSRVARAIGGVGWAITKFV